MGLDRFEIENLTSITVENAMQTEVPCLAKTADLLSCIKVLIDHSFICLVDDKQYFDGIVTRKAVLEQLNRFFHVNKEELKTFPF